MYILSFFPKSVKFTENGKLVVIGRSGRKWEMPKIPISVWANYVIYIYKFYKEKSCKYPPSKISVNSPPPPPTIYYICILNLFIPHFSVRRK